MCAEDFGIGVVHIKRCVLLMHSFLHQRMSMSDWNIPANRNVKRLNFNLLIYVCEQSQQQSLLS